MNKKLGKQSSTGLILPAVLAVALFVVSIFAVIIPTFKSNIMERKREMIRELTNSAWSVLKEFADEEKKGAISSEEARKRAIADIRHIRYGVERKDYFWLTDTEPKMIMHPYKPQLEGMNLSGAEGRDSMGKQLFVEMVKICARQQHGYVEYMWQWKDDSTRIVPKLSYVKSFKPWGWIIGTGIYLEDVKEEISAMTGRLITISILIIVIISLLLFFNIQKGLKIEHRRRLAEQNLMESEKKYRALVEAATEGTLMVLERKLFYSNTIIQNMLGYTPDDFELLELRDIFYESEGEKSKDYLYSVDNAAGPAVSRQYETKLKKKDAEPLDVTLTVSNISLAEKKGVIVMVRDISGHKQIAVELDRSREQHNLLTNQLDIGVFRTTAGRNGKFIEANPSAVRILGFDKKEDLFKITIFDLFHDKNDRIVLLKELVKCGFVKNRILQLKRSDGTRATISISVVLLKDETQEDRFCDGIVEDITERKRVEEGRENLITQLQTAQLFYNRSIKDFLGDITRCSMNTPIKKAAALMSKNQAGAILVHTEESGSNTGSVKSLQYIGIITDNDLRKRVVAEGIDLYRPAFEIMSSPLLALRENALIFEAMLLMQEKKIRHLAIKDESGTITGLISSEQMLHTLRSSFSFVLKEIHDAEDVETIIESRNRLPHLVKTLIVNGVNSKNISHIITSVSDAVLDRLMQFATEALGPPPVSFAFVGLGSEGRKEETLLTDQDNAIIYDDPDSPELKKDAEKYFLELGEKVCTWLNACGYEFCEGEIMGMTPKWCRPLSVWKKYFYDWIHTANPRDLLEINIFFDFRCLYGKKEFTTQLREYIDDLLDKTPAFLQYIARNALLYKPPIGFFGNIVTGTSGEDPSTFDIKHAMKPIVNFARIYALKNNIRETNTQVRLYKLFCANVLEKSGYEEIVQVYDYLMRMRFRHQAVALGENKKPDNLINPKMLTDIEYSWLKNTFSQINYFQKKLSYDFTGA
ncbi:MAG: PAS domain S-box protein [bacterium]|nr:PAS domain S-box protein [bacterium]